MPGIISPTALEQIRAASDIVEVIGGYLPLKRAGANFVAHCPFHKEKSPSFNVNPQRQIFHCFGCHKGGDVFTFVREYENLSFVEAVRRLAERARIPLEFDSDETHKRQAGLKEQLLQIHESITTRWQAALTTDASGQAARDYLAKRGVSDESVRLFRLGYAPDAWDDTVNWARTKHFEPALVEQAGLILRKEGSDRYYDRFRGRLIFPICDEQGRVIGFSGRILGDEKVAKYVNSPETPLFTKGRVFFGLDKAKRAMLDAGRALICEGQLDLIACHSAGVQNVVAPQGTAFTPDHARILRRYVEEVILCFDADTAGQEAAVRVHESLLASGLAIRVVTLPSPHDPDSYIKAFGGEAFRQLLEGAQDFLDFYLDHLSATHDLATDRGQLNVVRDMAALVRRTGDAVLLDKYAQKTAMRLSERMQLAITPDAVRRAFRHASAPARPTSLEPREPNATPESPAAPPAPLEFWLLKLVLLDDDLPAWAATRLDLRWITHPVVSEILRRRLGLDDAGIRPVARLMDELQDTQAQRLISEAASEKREIPNRPQQLADVLRRIRDQHLELELAALTQQLARADLTDADRVALLTRRQALRQEQRIPIPPP